MKIKRCDNCGKLNPPIFEGNPRLCAACVVPGGMYGSAKGPNGVRAVGKINYWTIRFPIRIEWRGWWRL